MLAKTTTRATAVEEEEEEALAEKTILEPRRSKKTEQNGKEGGRQPVEIINDVLCARRVLCDDHRGDPKKTKKERAKKRENDEAGCGQRHSTRLGVLPDSSIISLRAILSARDFAGKIRRGSLVVAGLDGGNDDDDDGQKKQRRSQRGRTEAS